ncbi:hypothetical protein UFOVP1146_215 [uncultured Caudovirales phage]|uniref:Uncharacterized protein n=1 Tax=uncultured Caudovirales phage TaxID=2100421 RepID=A0A6J5QQ85_9CAUD|nr:hypothetical protein UFOVP812_128 [uncultured Caudovirales phage]CAB4165253.1 hypothetical protein UFOVP818_15 [uncultured Caudovirales phage]CAB4186869.1 hypothetical protein UFOVP1146_215 [uncultured Caudovirales phage]CAB4221498.1 hypothetical protein UFOVP1638_350 [uncultured Caudovirales phage]
MENSKENPWDISKSFTTVTTGTTYTLPNQSSLADLAANSAVRLTGANTSWIDSSTLANHKWHSNPTWIDENTSSVVKLQGPDADITINGASLNETLRGIQDRLNILTPNAALEEEWESLRCLGEQYRLLEKEILEKQQVWALLKKKAPKL